MSGGEIARVAEAIPDPAGEWAAARAAWQQARDRHSAERQRLHQRSRGPAAPTGRLVEPARLADSTGGGLSFARLMLFTVLAAAAGGGAAWLVRRCGTRTFQEPREVADALGLPLIGTWATAPLPAPSPRVVRQAAPWVIGGSEAALLLLVAVLLWRAV